MVGVCSHLVRTPQQLCITWQCYIIHIPLPVWSSLNNAPGLSICSNIVSTHGGNYADIDEHHPVSPSTVYPSTYIWLHLKHIDVYTAVIIISYVYGRDIDHWLTLTSSACGRVNHSSWFNVKRHHTIMIWHSNCYCYTYCDNGSCFHQLGTIVNKLCAAHTLVIELYQSVAPYPTGSYLIACVVQ